MAQVSPFILSPNALVSIYGLIHGPDRTVATPGQDWRKAVVDVVIPALNEQDCIVLCIASVLRQTFPPRQVILIDDGSTDQTVERAKAFAEANGIKLLAIKRDHPIGKTPTIKRQAREFDADVEFILDGDTFLESPNYIERTVQELYEAAGIASACGTILPMRGKDQRRAMGWPALVAFGATHPEVTLPRDVRWIQRVRRGITNMYREVLYVFLQGFLYRGQMAMFGSITNPVGCAVAYKRQYVKDLFDHYEPILGDDLTNSEDIFIGFALLAQGYRNIQLHDVVAHSREPEAHRLPRQVYMWSSSFLQSCFYFDVLLRSPFKSIKRYLHERRGRIKYAEQIKLRRKIQEPYRQRWGLEYTREFGRPIGWTLLTSALEKVFFPIALLAMALMGRWEALGITLGVESALMVGVLGVVGRGRRLKCVAKGVIVTPLRYAYLLFEFVTLARFAADIWFRRNRKWRK